MLVTILVIGSCPVQRTLATGGRYHSQYGQDAYLAKLARGGRTYLDIGCNDGIDGSNTYYFYSLGWYGKCIEADPRTYARIRAHSKRTDGLNFAVSNSSRASRFTRVLDPNNGLSGLSAHMSVHKRAPWTRFKTETTRVPTIRPFSLLHRYYRNVTTIDVVSLDVEGGELNILRSWPFIMKRWCVRVFVIEDNDWCNERTTLPELSRMLTPMGYRHLESIGMDYVFERSCAPMRRGAE